MNHLQPLSPSPLLVINQNTRQPRHHPSTSTIPAHITISPQTSKQACQPPTSQSPPKSQNPSIGPWIQNKDNHSTVEMSQIIAQMPRESCNPRRDTTCAHAKYAQRSTASGTVHGRRMICSRVSRMKMALWVWVWSEHTYKARACKPLAWQARTLNLL